MFFRNDGDQRTEKKTEAKAAKGATKSADEAKAGKPKAKKEKTIAANPSTKEGVVRGLENFKK